MSTKERNDVALRLVMSTIRTEVAIVKKAQDYELMTELQVYLSKYIDIVVGNLDVVQKLEKLDPLPEGVELWKLNCRSHLNTIPEVDVEIDEVEVRPVENKAAIEAFQKMAAEADTGPKQKQKQNENTLKKAEFINPEVELSKARSDMEVDAYCSNERSGRNMGLLEQVVDTKEVLAISAVEQLVTTIPTTTSGGFVHRREPGNGSSGSIGGGNSDGGSGNSGGGMSTGVSTTGYTGEYTNHDGGGNGGATGGNGNNNSNNNGNSTQKQKTKTKHNGDGTSTEVDKVDTDMDVVANAVSVPVQNRNLKSISSKYVFREYTYIWSIYVCVYIYDIH